MSDSFPHMKHLYGKEKKLEVIWPKVLNSIRSIILLDKHVREQVNLTKRQTKTDGQDNLFFDEIIIVFDEARGLIVQGRDNFSPLSTTLDSRRSMWTICESKQLIQSSGDARNQVKDCPLLSKHSSRFASVASHRKNTGYSEVIGTPPLELYPTVYYCLSIRPPKDPACSSRRARDPMGVHKDKEGNRIPKPAFVK